MERVKQGEGRDGGLLMQHGEECVLLVLNKCLLHKWMSATVHSLIFVQFNGPSRNDVLCLTLLSSLPGVSILIFWIIILHYFYVSNKLIIET